MGHACASHLCWSPCCAGDCDPLLLALVCFQPWLKLLDSAWLKHTSSSCATTSNVSTGEGGSCLIVAVPHVAAGCTYIVPIKKIFTLVLCCSLVHCCCTLCTELVYFVLPTCLFPSALGCLWVEDVLSVSTVPYLILCHPVFCIKCIEIFTSDNLSRCLHCSYAVGTATTTAGGVASLSFGQTRPHQLSCGPLSSSASYFCDDFVQVC